MLSDDSSIYGYIVFFLMIRRPPRSTRTDTLFPYTTLFRAALSLRGREKGASTPSVTPGHRRNMIRSARAFYVVSLLSMFIRSEEHTSELQSLMSISYAVFCLKKKTTNKTTPQNTTT